MKNKKLLLLSTLGSALEYFDFVIYALAISYISLHFFPQESAIFNMLQALLLFATGYIFRPLGGFVFGMVGDQYGRKNSFTASILLMGFATLSIGLLPTYDQIGLLSPVVLFLARATQGIAQGAELAGAFTFVYEHEPDKKQAPYALSILNSGIGFGALLGSSFFSLLTLCLTEGQMMEFGWRLPFILGGVAAFIGYFLRKSTLETPEFVRQKNISGCFGLSNFFINHWQNIFSGIGLVLFPATLIINFLFIPSFLNTFYHFSAKTVFVLQTFGLVWSAMLLPFTGKLAVRLDPSRQMRWSLKLSIFIIPIAYLLLATEHVLGLLGFVILYQSLIALLAACYSVILTASFPVKVRYKGTAISYNIAFAIAGFSPYLFTKVIYSFNSLMIMPILLLGICLVSLLLWPSSSSMGE